MKPPHKNLSAIGGEGALIEQAVVDHENADLREAVRVLVESIKRARPFIPHLGQRSGLYLGEPCNIACPFCRLGHALEHPTVKKVTG